MNANGRNCTGLECIHFYNVHTYSKSSQLSFSVQRYMSVMKVYISVNTLAPIHTVLMFALATVAILSQAMDSPAVVRTTNIIIFLIHICIFKSRY